MNTETTNQDKTGYTSVEELVELIYLFLDSRSLSRLRLSDLWKLIKLEYPDNDVVLYWKERNKEKHGIPVEVSSLLSDDKRFIKYSKGRKEVYYSLAD